MVKNNSALVFTALVFTGFASNALADSFRCGPHLIREGMQAAEITDKCGEPGTVTTIQEPIMARRQNGSAFQVGVATVELWTYDRGSRAFPARVRIEEGRAKTIELMRRDPSW